MATSRVKTSSILQGFPKSRSLLAGNTYFQPTSYESIATINVGSGGASDITFSSIPSTYTHLQIRAISKTNRTSASVDSLKIQFNGDTTGTNYAYHELIGDGASVLSDNVTSNAYAAIARTAGNANTSFFGGFTCDILDYRNSNKYKTVRTLSGVDLNGSGAVFFNSGLWQSFSAITTSIKISPETGTLLAQHSSFALYGIKGA